MLRRSALIVTAATAAVFSVATGDLAAQTVNEAPGTLYEATALTGFATQADDMAGMQIIGYDNFGTAFSGTWGNFFNGSWGVQTSLFRISLAAGTNSFTTNAWTLNSFGNLASLTFRGAGGSTIFDRDKNGGAEVTPGSANGRDFQLAVGDIWNTTVDYLNAVGVGGNAPLGDIYERLDVTFGNTMTVNTQVKFSLDTDNATTGPGNVFVPVPAPAGAALLLSGLLGMGLMGVGRRRIGSEV